MRDLKVDCPKTGRQIGTGIATDEITFERIQSYELRVLCPHCGETHELPLRGFKQDQAA